MLLGSSNLPLNHIYVLYNTIFIYGGGVIYSIQRNHISQRLVSHNNLPTQYQTCVVILAYAD